MLLWPPCGGNILDKYEVRLIHQALQDLDEIYGYIVSTLQVPGAAAELLDALESVILSLEYLPYRCSERGTVQAHAQRMVESTTVFINRAITEAMERDKGGI